MDDHYKRTKGEKKKMNVLSLFSGCGGMDIGFEGNFKCLKRSINEKLHPSWIKQKDGEFVTVEATGFKTVFANDIREDARTAWVSYFSQSNVDADKMYHVESIVDLVKRERNGEKIFPDNIDVVTGGFPCQDFSIAGKRKGFNSDKSHNGKLLEMNEPSVESRGQLYMWMREVISITQPLMFIAENVKGLTNLEDVKEIIENDFATAAHGGYLVVPARILHAADYGVPQSRERVIFFGFRKEALLDNAKNALLEKKIPSKYDPYPPKTHRFTIEKKCLEKVVSCREAFVGLEEPDITNDESQKKYSKAKFMGNHCQGQTEVKMDCIGPTIRAEHHGNIEFRRLSREHGGKNEKELKQGFIERRLTVRECARLQTFPDEYQFIHSKSKEYSSVSGSAAYKIIGNAVPCVLAYNIAKHISEKWDMYFGGKVK